MSERNAIQRRGTAVVRRHHIDAAFCIVAKKNPTINMDVLRQQFNTALEKELRNQPIPRASQKKIKSLELYTNESRTAAYRIRILGNHGEELFQRKFQRRRRNNFSTSHPLLSIAKSNPIDKTLSCNNLQQIMGLSTFGEVNLEMTPWVKAGLFKKTGSGQESKYYITVRSITWHIEDPPKPYY